MAGTAQTVTDKPGKPPVGAQAKKKSSKARQLVQHGWLSGEHGAWPIAILPLIFGIIVGVGLPACETSLGMPAPRYTTGQNAMLAISATATVIGWMAAFLDFSALTAWLKSQRKPRYNKAIVTYSIIAGICAILVVVLTPAFTIWAILFAPFFAVTALLTWTGQERAFRTRLCSILASMLMVPALADIVSGRVYSQCRSWHIAYMLDQPYVWMITAGLAAYYVGSVPYVKTMIRQRGSRGWLTFSIALHVALLAITIWGYWQGYFSVVAVATWTILTVRSAYMPWLAHKNGRPLHPRKVGRPEIVYSILVVISLIASIPQV